MAGTAPQSQQPTPAPEKPKGNKMFLVVIAALMAVEGVGVFFVAKMFSGSPSTAAASEEGDAHNGGNPSHAAEADKPSATAYGQPEKADAAHGSAKKDEHGKPSGHGGPAGDMSEPIADDYAEIKLAECKTFNKETGKLVLFHIRVSILAATPEAERARKLVEAKQSRIDDRVNTVIRSAEPRHLNEPGLETLKRRLKFELDRIFEDPKLVHEILIPYLVQSGTGL